MQTLSAPLCGVLASFLCCLGCHGTFLVWQTPSEVVVKLKQSVQITCCLNHSITGTKVKWFVDAHEVHLSHLESKNYSCVALTITITYKNDTGHYICEFTQDKPQLTRVNGTGTHIKHQEENVSTFTTPNPPSTFSPRTNIELKLGSVLGAMGLMCTCACLIVWKLSRKCQRTERVVIREGPPSEEEPENSEEEEQNSRGSTQWYMVPVYESYFDLQRSDEQESAASEKTGSTASEKTESAASEKTGSAKTGSIMSRKAGSFFSGKTRSAASRKTGSVVSRKTGSIVSQKSETAASEKTRPA